MCLCLCFVLQKAISQAMINSLNRAEETALFRLTGLRLEKPIVTPCRIKLKAVSVKSEERL